MNTEYLQVIAIVAAEIWERMMVPVRERNRAEFEQRLEQWTPDFFKP